MSENEGDWLGSGIYFWQDAPKRAERWARRISRAKGDRPAVLVAEIDLADSLDLLDIWGFEELKRQYRAFSALPGTPTQEPLELAGGATVWPADGMELVNRNKRDKAVLDFAAVALGHMTGTPVTAIRGSFLWGDALYEESFLFDWSNVQIAVRERTAIQSLTSFSL